MQTGDLVRVEMTKWGEAQHWRFTGTYLGSDEHGDWLGIPAGTHHARPGFAFDSEVDSVTLFPHEDWFCATFHAPGTWCDLYVDISSPPQRDGHVLRVVDLDLDVIRMSSQLPESSTVAPQNRSPGPGEVFVDDEDEFAEHQVSLAYPADVIASARASCDRVLTAVLAGEAPYNGTHRRWLDALRRRA